MKPLRASISGCLPEQDENGHCQKQKKYRAKFHIDSGQ